MKNPKSSHRNAHNIRFMIISKRLWLGKRLFIFFCLAAFVFTSYRANAQQLPRVDANWVLFDSKFIDTLFGPTVISFNEAVEVNFPLDSVGFKFEWTNTSYTIPNTEVSIFADGCVVNRGLVDSVFYTGLEQPTSFLVDRYCSTIGSDIYTRFVPLGEDTIAAIYELRRGGNPQAGFFGIFEGLGIAMLSVDSLLAKDDARSAVLAPPTFWLPQDTLLREAVGLTPHPQGGWWIITHGLVDTDRWHVMRLTADTLIQRSDQFVGPLSVLFDDYGVNINFSPRGDRFILKGGSAGNSLYDFDVQTGEISHVSTFRHPNPEWEPFRYFTGGAFSASGRYFYYTDETTVWQLDLSVTDLDSAWIQLNPTARPGRQNGYWQASRAPDCRIYLGWPGSNIQLSVIEKPEWKGSAVDFKNRGLLTKYYFGGIPQHPNYHLWARARLERGLAPLIDTAVCDSTIVGYDYVADPVSSIREAFSRGEVAKLTVFPSLIVSGAQLQLVWPEVAGTSASGTVLLFDGLGRIVEQFSWPAGEDQVSIHLPGGLASGTYRLVAQVQQGGERRFASGSVVVQ